jgi:hypothetical protein
MEGKKPIFINGMTILPCDFKSYEPLSFYIDGYWFTVNPESYLFKVRTVSAAHIA